MIGLGIRIGQSKFIKTITEGWDLFLNSNNTEPLNTANAVTTNAVNKSYIKFQNDIITTENWGLTFVCGKIDLGFNYLIGSESTNNSNLNIQASQITIRTAAAVNHVIAYDFSTLAENHIFKIESTFSDDKFNLFKDGVLVGSVVGTATSHVMEFQTLALRGTTIYSSNTYNYLAFEKLLGTISNEYLFIKGNDHQIIDTVGGNHGIFETNNANPLLVPTWEIGKQTPISVGSQISLINHNRYIKGTNGALNYIEFNTPLPTPGSFDSYLRIKMKLPKGGSSSLKYVFNMLGVGNSYFHLNLNNIVLTINGTGMVYNSPSLFDGNYHNILFWRLQGRGIDLYINGQFVQHYANELDFPSIDLIGHKTFTSSYEDGVALLDLNGNIATYSNNWNGGYTMVGTHSEILMPEIGTTGFDAIGEPIENPKLHNAYSFSGQNHWLDSETILTRTSSCSDGFWIKPQSTQGNEIFASDDVLTIGSSATNFLQATFNGVTLVSTQSLVFNHWYYVKFTQNGSGTGIIYVGTIFSPPVILVTGAVGLPVAATTNFLIGK